MMHEKIIGRLNFIKIKNVFSVKDNVKSMRNQATVRKKIFSIAQLTLIQNIQ